MVKMVMLTSRIFFHNLKLFKYNTCRIYELRIYACTVCARAVSYADI